VVRSLQTGRALDSSKRFQRWLGHKRRNRSFCPFEKKAALIFEVSLDSKPYHFSGPWNGYQLHLQLRPMTSGLRDAITVNQSASIFRQEA